VKRVVWTEPAKADVRALDKPTAIRILSPFIASRNQPRAMSRRSSASDKKYGSASAMTGCSSPTPLTTRLKFAAFCTTRMLTAELG
jgi:hypothetical protein